MAYCKLCGMAVKLNWIEWGLKSFQHILGYLMTFPVLLVEEGLGIIQTE